MSGVISLSDFPQIQNSEFNFKALFWYLRNYIYLKGRLLWRLLLDFKIQNRKIK